MKNTNKTEELTQRVYREVTESHRESYKWRNLYIVNREEKQWNEVKQNKNIMEQDEITKKIIGCAIEVHKNLGPGLLESAYEECLAYELLKEGLNIKRQQPTQVVYKKIKLECGYRIDILVENSVVVELKVVDTLNPVHEAQILTYVKFANKTLGLLINFNVTLLKNSHRRYIF
jgi:GxxExxY protein